MSERVTNTRDSILTSIIKLLDEIDGFATDEIEAGDLPTLAMTVVLLSEAWSVFDE